MASIRKLPRSKYWIAQFRDLNSKLHNRSTGVPDEGTAKERSDARKRAKAIAEEYERLARGMVLTEAQIRKTVVELVKLTGRNVTQESIDDYFRQWLERIAAQKTKTTYTRYKGVVLRFLAYLGERAQLPLEGLTTEDIQGYLDAEMAAGKVAKTCSDDLKAIRIPLNYATRSGRLPANPASLVSVSGQGESREPFTVAEINSMLAKLDEQHLPEYLQEVSEDWKTAILLSGYGGMRLGDVTLLTWGRIDFQNKLLRFTPEKTRRSRKELAVPMHPRLERHLLGLSVPDDPRAPVCPLLAADTGKRARLSKQFQEIMAAAGIDSRPGEEKTGKGRRFNRKSFHSLRHTFASLMANAGIPAEVRQKLTGHADADVHSLYTHLELKPLRAAVEALPEA